MEDIVIIIIIIISCFIVYIYIYLYMHSLEKSLRSRESLRTHSMLRQGSPKLAPEKSNALLDRARSK